ncbi:hypothetical protein PRIPAC_84500 [Pristionchus pacificus]|uniref:Uncharacterized protein n=1 Tax=Pristionchus pacificus TaxID=54126 RepID=A0A2A6CCN7_PRIPA|nr:hypothetical protein PRIPAC_84500 [Pristionchus pacificus]|eukprot:PDM75803.1 hypothetical protein PRIPAC_40182 [Pristionchus pacificus]
MKSGEGREKERGTSNLEKDQSQPEQIPEPGSSQTVVVAIYLKVQPRSIPVAVGGPACKPPLGHAATRPSGRREAPSAAIEASGGFSWRERRRDGLQECDEMAPLTGHDNTNEKKDTTT